MSAFKAELLFTEEDGEQYTQSPGYIDLAYSDDNEISIDIQDRATGEVQQIITLYVDAFTAWRLSEELADLAKQAAPDYGELATESNAS